jgi:cyanophycinase-like exopeptidase
LMMIGSLAQSSSSDGVFLERLIQDGGGAKDFRLLVVSDGSQAGDSVFLHLTRMAQAKGVSAAQFELTHPGDQDLAALNRASAVWLSGNEDKPISLVNQLLGSLGQGTTFLLRLRERFAAGQLIIASHGAAARTLGSWFIIKGTSRGALARASEIRADCLTSLADKYLGNLCLTSGLGFIPPELKVVVDSHFFSQGRLGRLLRALAVSQQSVGWGIGDSTGLYVHFDQGTAEIMGLPRKSYLCILGRHESLDHDEQQGPPFVGKNYIISILSVGDFYRLPNNADPQGVVGRPQSQGEYHPFSKDSHSYPTVQTDAFGNNILLEGILRSFADDIPQPGPLPHVDALALFKNDGTGLAEGVRLRFTPDASSMVAYGSEAGFSMFRARLQISLVRASFPSLAEDAPH